MADATGADMVSVHPGTALRRRVDVRVAPAAVTGTAIVAGAAAAAVAVARPGAVLLAVAAVAVLGAMVLRVEWAALAFVAIEPFEGYVKDVSGTGVKLVGALLFIAWLVRLLARGRTSPVGTAATFRSPAVISAGVLVLVLLAALTLHPNGTTGIEVAARYLSFVAALVVLVDCMRTTLPMRTVAKVFVLSCTVAALVALVGFLQHGAGHRAGGPVEDPNDFAFYLITAVPLALGLWRGATRWRALWPLAATVLTVVTALTFSRGALLGLAAMVIFALLTGQVRARAAIPVVAVVAVIGAVSFLAAPAAIQRSLAYKSNVASQNVEDRYTTWRIAGRMTAAAPVLGVGPGGFSTDFEHYRPAGTAQTPYFSVVHDMYLEVSAELGLLGLVAFLAMIGSGFAAARRRWRQDRDPLAAATCSAFVGTLLAAVFLSEQYFLPIWLLVAFGAALAAPGVRLPAPRLPALAGAG